jgi:L-alanine-DL-glutamate epimerase-like enolase superfamily enzyme
MIGGATRSRLHFYCTGPEPASAKAVGFIGGKVPLPYCPDEGQAGLAKNIAFLKEHREAVGPDFPLRVDCYMSLNVSYTIDLVAAANRARIP